MHPAENLSAPQTYSPLAPEVHGPDPIGIRILTPHGTWQPWTHKVLPIRKVPNTLAV